MKKGFTLIEVVIVIAITGILATAGITSFTASYQKANDSKRKTDLEALRGAFEIFKNDYGNYPNVNSWMCGNNLVSNMSIGSTPLPPTYIKVFPRDPRETGGISATTSTSYNYCFRSAGLCSTTTDPNGSYFVMVARLENTSDPDIVPVVAGQNNIQVTSTCSIAPPSAGLYVVTSP